jgi:hypothetical protein
MTKTDSVTSCLIIFSHIHDDFSTLGEVVDPYDLLRKTLNGFYKPWEIFVQGIVAKENMPS